ncbi:hypothetical protein HD597_012888 [Nonomuraea thailandensis]|uniref:Uncharacterized protein n=1 Tax=Nonomuraea thailandensis TaxID=1188745 RepID=A0A9X2KAM8_9ACTN|nr:hypothetical protein [Nonomuraea thailandensis]MCP2365784.1 hypothetical protein [Nonomuraea thailandensis]
MGEHAYMRTPRMGARLWRAFRRPEPPAAGLSAEIAAYNWHTAFARKRLHDAYEHLRAITATAYRAAAEHDDQVLAKELDAIHEDLRADLLEASRKIRRQMAARGYADDLRHDTPPAEESGHSSALNNRAKRR